MLNREDIGETKFPSGGLTLVEFLDYWERGSDKWKGDGLEISDMREDLAEVVDLTHELLALIDELKQAKGGET